MRARCLVALLVAAGVMPLPCAAQSASAAHGPNHPDWTGYYRGARAADLAGLSLAQATDAALDAEIDTHLQPWARVKMQQTYGVADDLGAVCQLTGIFRIPIRGGGFMWLPTPDGRKVILSSTSIFSAGSRNIFIGGAHPKYPSPTWLGHSVGRWDGDTLVVDTVGFNDKSWLTSSMQPHTEALHVVERYRMYRPGLIELQTTVDDRQTLVSPYTYTRYYKRLADERPELVCNPDEGDMRMWTEFRVKALKFGMLPVAAKEPARTPVE
jgi:hypothetical protein